MATFYLAGCIRPNACLSTSSLRLFTDVGEAGRHAMSVSGGSEYRARVYEVTPDNAPKLLKPKLWKHLLTV